MPISLSFTPSISVVKESHVPWKQRYRLQCALAPERTESSERRKSCRVLRDDLPPSSRPPPPPRHYGIPLVGFFLERLFFKSGALIRSKTATYGPIFRSNYRLFDAVYVTKYETIVEILRNDELFICAGSSRRLEAIIPGNMLSLDGVEHQRQRKLLAPAFSSRVFPLYFPSLSRRANGLWNQISSALTRGESITLDPWFHTHYTAMVVELSTGINMDGKESARIADLFKRLISGVLTVGLGPLYAPAQKAQDDFVEILSGVIREKIAQDRSILENLRTQGEDFAKLGASAMKRGDLDLLHVILANSDISLIPDADLDDNVLRNLAISTMGIWFAGYSTSASTSTSASMELGFNPELYARLVNEQESLISSSGGDRKVAYEQVVSGMPLLDSFISEVLRLHSPATQQQRIAGVDVEIEGRFVAKGSKVCLNIDAANRDEFVYPSADELIPERFMRKPSPPAALTFGVPGSPHYCIGANLARIMMKTTFSSLLREYTFELDTKQSREFKYLPERIPKSGVLLQNLQRRTE